MSKRESASAIRRQRHRLRVLAQRNWLRDIYTPEELRSIRYEATHGLQRHKKFKVRRCRYCDRSLKGIKQLPKDHDSHGTCYVCRAAIENGDMTPVVMKTVRLRFGDTDGSMVKSQYLNSAEESWDDVIRCIEDYPS